MPKPIKKKSYVKPSFKTEPLFSYGKKDELYKNKTIYAGKINDRDNHHTKKMYPFSRIIKYGQLGTLSYRHKYIRDINSIEFYENYKEYREYMLKNPGTYLIGIRSHLSTIGVRLLREVERLALKEGKKYIFLKADLENFPKLNYFYARNGYEPIGTVREYTVYIKIL